MVMNEKFCKNEAMKTIDTFLETERVPLGYKKIKVEKMSFPGGLFASKVGQF
jgi:hypothetical protein